MEDENCTKHGVKALVFNDKTNSKMYFLCRICMFQSKEDLKFYEENFENFSLKYSQECKENKLKDYEGFEHINKIFKEKSENLQLGTDEILKVKANEKKIIDELKSAIFETYSSTTKKFEETVENLTEKTEKIDLNLKTARDEVEKIQNDLDEQIELLESEEKIEAIFNKVITKFNNKIKYLDITKYIDPELKFKIRRGGGNINFTNGTPTILSARRNGVSYWCERSEEIFDGAFFARIRVNNITRKSDWSLSIGIQRANSTNTNSYYQDGCFMMCSGKISVQFQGNSGRSIFRQWNNGDEILLMRDDNNDVYCGLNEETLMEKCYSNIAGAYRLCVGFSSGMSGDNIEILEVDN